MRSAPAGLGGTQASKLRAHPTHYLAHTPLPLLRVLVVVVPAFLCVFLSGG
jgi:hypothetical protein